MMLPFALLPILQFTSDPRIMGWFRSPAPLLATIWCLSFLVFGINVYLVVSEVTSLDLALGQIAGVVVLYVVYSVVVLYFLVKAVGLRISWLERLFPQPAQKGAGGQGQEAFEKAVYSEDDQLVGNEIVENSN